MTFYGEVQAFVTQLSVRPLPAECIIWPYSVNRKGYPQMSWRGKVRSVSHVLMELAGRPKPTVPGIEYCHGDVCAGERRCVNIGHGRWDSHEANIADKVNLGRSLSGDDHPSAKITAADVAQIRQAHAVGDVTQRQLALHFGVSSSLVNMIVMNRHRPASARKVAPRKGKS